MLLRLVVSLVVIAGSIAPSVALAWTRAQVRDVRARLEIDVGGRTQVQLALAVEVQSGWLERLELPGFDEDMRLLDEHGAGREGESAAPAWVTLESGERAAAQARLEGGVLTLHFARRELRRGIHLVHVQYTTDLAGRAQPQPGGFSRLSWTLPGWEAALSGAEIVILGPGALRAVAEPDAAAAIETGMEGDRRMVRFTRVHVSRASPWRVALELPSPALASATPPLPVRVEALPTPSERRRTGLLLGTAIGLIVTWGGRRTRARLAALGRSPRPWLTPFRMPWWAPGALCSLSGACWQWWPSVALIGWSALIALGVERAAAPAEVLAFGRFEPVGGLALQRLARARERGRLVSADPASVFGVGLLLSGLLALAWAQAPFAPADPWGLGLLCALLAFVASSRLWQPRALAEQVGLLQRAARSTRMQACALSLLWYVAAEARGQPRLRVLPRARYTGLLRIELLVDTRRGAPALVLSVLTEAGSPAARWTRALWPHALREPSKGGARTAFLKPVTELSGPLETLFEHFTRESQRAMERTRGEQERAA